MTRRNSICCQCGHGNFTHSGHIAGCGLTGVDFSRSTLDQADLRGSELGLAGPEPLRGAIVSTGQLTAVAPVLAESLGIVVDDG